MTREEKVRKLLAELTDMIDNGSQRDLDRADEICTSIIKLFEQKPSEDCISRQTAQNKIKKICNKYGLSYEDGERKPSTGGSAYALGHAFDNLPTVTQQENYVNIPFLMHKEMNIPISECQKAYDVAIDYLRSQTKVKG